MAGEWQLTKTVNVVASGATGDDVNGPVTAVDLALTTSGRSSGGFMVEGKWIDGASTLGRIEVGFNGHDTCVCDSQGWRGVGSAAPTATQGTNGEMCWINADSESEFIAVCDYPDDTLGGEIHVLSTCLRDTGANVELFKIHTSVEFWDAAGTGQEEITSFDMEASVTNGIGVGSVFRLYERTV
jgi:hypothetical protein